MSLLNRGHRGQLRERYIGEGKSAIPFINYGRPGAKAKEDYITKRIHYCKVWGLRLKPLN